MGSVIEELQDKQAQMKAASKGTSIVASSHSPEPADTASVGEVSNAASSDAE